MKKAIARIAIHGFLFLLAVVLFYLGLGVGLQYSPAIGVAIWVAAALLVLLNVFWLFCRARRK